MNRRRIAGPFRAFTTAEWASTPIPRLCDGNVAPLKWTLRRRFIDVTPTESSKVAYYTPMPRLWFLTWMRPELNELTRAILMLRFSIFLRNSIIHFCMFLYLETYFLRDTRSTCIMFHMFYIYVPIYPYLISEGRRNCSTLRPSQHRNRDS